MVSEIIQWITYPIIHIFDDILINSKWIDLIGFTPLAIAITFACTCILFRVLLVPANAGSIISIGGVAMARRYTRAHAKDMIYDKGNSKLNSGERAQLRTGGSK